MESVISSEMSATSSIELLKAHAVISRSWLLAQIEQRRKQQTSAGQNGFFSFIRKDDELINGTTARTIPYSTFAPTTIANAIRASQRLQAHRWHRPFTPHADRYS